VKRVKCGVKSAENLCGKVGKYQSSISSADAHRITSKSRCHYDSGIRKYDIRLQLIPMGLAQMRNMKLRNYASFSETGRPISMRFSTACTTVGGKSPESFGTLAATVEFANFNVKFLNFVVAGGARRRVTVLFTDGCTVKEQTA